MRWLDVPAPVKRMAIERIRFRGEVLSSTGDVPAAILAAVAELERVPVHARVGPAMDVAPCQERGSHLRFSMSGAGITCPTCKGMRHNTVSSAAQLKKIRTVATNRKAAARAEVPGDKGR